VQEQVVSLHAGTNGYLDPIPVEDVPRYERELLEWMRSRHGALLDGIKTSGDIEDMDAFESALRGFAEQFQASDGTSAAAEPTPAEVVAADAALTDEAAAGDDAEAGS
jgi:F-type H+-transporting ATPase subunit alpha